MTGVNTACYIRTMPNQRAKGKKVIGTWVDDQTVAELDRIAKRLKLPRSKVIEMIIEDEIKKTRSQPQ